MSRIAKLLAAGVLGGGAAQTYAQKVALIEPANLIDWSKMAEASGATAVDSSQLASNGAYTGVTLAQPGIGDGLAAASFDGTTSFNNRYTVARAAAFNGDEGTLAGWFKMSGVGVWTDGTKRLLARFAVNDNNTIELVRTTTDNQLQWLRFAAGASFNNATTLALAGVTDWFHLGLTWSDAADEIKFYINGTQEGATGTGLAAWSGSVAATLCCVGAFSTIPNFVHSGLAAHVMLWNTPITALQMAAAASLNP